jgi:hypothetical protein
MSETKREMMRVKVGQLFGMSHYKLWASEDGDEQAYEFRFSTLQFILYKLLTSNKLIIIVFSKFL